MLRLLKLRRLHSQQSQNAKKVQYIQINEADFLLDVRKRECHSLWRYGMLAFPESAISQRSGSLHEIHSD